MSDENFSVTKENIISDDTIIIDEISMFSLKLLEQIHYVMKSVRKKTVIHFVQCKNFIRRLLPIASCAKLKVLK